MSDENVQALVDYRLAVGPRAFNLALISCSIGTAYKNTTQRPLPTAQATSWWRRSGFTFLGPLTIADTPPQIMKKRRPFNNSDSRSFPRVSLLTL